MGQHSFKLKGNRTLTVAALSAPIDQAVQPPFVALMPACSATERQQAEAVTRALIKAGCVELCCVGPEAELLHDALDEIIETDGTLEVVTTAIEDPVEACEYFVHAAAGGRADLLALVQAHPELQSALDAEASSIDRDAL